MQFTVQIADTSYQAAIEFLQLIQNALTRLRLTQPVLRQVQKQAYTAKIVRHGYQVVQQLLRNLTHTLGKLQLPQVMNHQALRPVSAHVVTQRQKLSQQQATHSAVGQ